MQNNQYFGLTMFIPLSYHSTKESSKFLAHGKMEGSNGIEEGKFVNYTNHIWTSMGRTDQKNGSVWECLHLAFNLVPNRLEPGKACPTLW